MLKQIRPWLIVALVVGLLSVTIFEQKAPMVQSFQKTNGAVVTFLGATYGTNHTVVTGGSFRRTLYKILPAKLKSMSGARVVVFNTNNTNAPTFWIHETSLKPGSAATGARPPDEFLQMRVADEFGCEYDPNGYSSGTHYSEREGSIHYYQIDTPDPHGKIVGLCFYDSQTKTQRLGSFMIPGTSVVPMPPAVEPAPAKQDGELTFQLIALVTGLKSVPYSYPKMTNGVLYSEAILRINKNGAQAPSWFPEDLTVKDAHGKVMTIRRHQRGFRVGDSVLNFEGALDPAAGPFKLRVEFQHQSEFSPEELVTIKDVPFPATLESLSPKMEAEAQGRRVIVENVIGAFAQRAVTFYQTSQPIIRARITPANNSVHLQLVRAVDESGTELQQWGTAPMGKGEYYFSFAPATKAKTMDLIFAVHQSRYAEFEATPVLFQSNGPAKK